MLLIELNQGKEQACFTAKDIVSVALTNATIQIRMRNHTSIQDYFNLNIDDKEKAKSLYLDILEVLKEA